jgi:hypothetical protein
LCVSRFSWVLVLISWQGLNILGWYMSNAQAVFTMFSRNGRGLRGIRVGHWEEKSATTLSDSPYKG